MKEPAEPSLKKPTAHAMHEVNEPWPMLGLYRPAQTKQMMFANTHDTRAPAGHDKHWLALVAPRAARYVPSGQRSHVGWPGTTEKVPAAQGEHTEAAVPPGSE